jgi:hypothetical protein
MRTETTQPKGNGSPEGPKECEGETFLYIRVEVAQPNPVSTGAFNLLAGMVGAKPKLDTELHPGCIGFRHVQLVAKDEEHAYAIGDGLLPALEPDTIVANDYVVKL